MSNVQVALLYLRDADTISSFIKGMHTAGFTIGA